MIFVKIFFSVFRSSNLIIRLHKLHTILITCCRWSLIKISVKFKRNNYPSLVTYDLWKTILERFSTSQRNCRRKVLSHIKSIGKISIHGFRMNFKNVSSSMICVSLFGTTKELFFFCWGGGMANNKMQ